MRKTLVTLLVGVMLILSACGGGSQAAKEIDVTMTDFQFSPNTFTVPAGEEITLHAANNGAVVHNFVIMKLGQTAGDTFDAQDQPNVYWEVELQPGSNTDTTFTAPTDPGEYQVVCRTPGHLAAGMTATLKVVSGQ